MMFQTRRLFPQLLRFKHTKRHYYYYYYFFFFFSVIQQQVIPTKIIMMIMFVVVSQLFPPPPPVLFVTAFHYHPPIPRLLWRNFRTCCCKLQKQKQQQPQHKFFIQQTYNSNNNNKITITATTNHEPYHRHHDWTRTTRRSRTFVTNQQQTRSFRFMNNIVSKNNHHFLTIGNVSPRCSHIILSSSKTASSSNDGLYVTTTSNSQQFISTDTNVSISSISSSLESTSKTNHTKDVMNQNDQQHMIHEKRNNNTQQQSTTTTCTTRMIFPMSLEERYMKKDCQKIIHAAIDAVNPVNAIRQHLQIIKDRAIEPTTVSKTSKNNNHNNKVLLRVIGCVNPNVLLPTTTNNNTVNYDTIEEEEEERKTKRTHVHADDDDDDDSSTNSHHHHNHPFDVTYDILNEYHHIAIIGFGKASSLMATTVVEQINEILRYEEEDVEGPKSSCGGSTTMSGIIICKDDHCSQKEYEYLYENNIIVKEASHPIPDIRSINASNELLQYVKELSNNNNENNNNNTSSAMSPNMKKKRKKILVIACISGGGSSLFCSPFLSLPDMIQTNTILLQSGISILDMNVIRKRLERGKGGKLAVAVSGNDNGSGDEQSQTQLLSLILSDVIGDPLDFIASGPTVPDRSTWLDAWNIIQNNKFLQNNLPKSVIQLIQMGRMKMMMEEEEEKRNNLNPVIENKKNSKNEEDDDDDTVSKTVFDMNSSSLLSIPTMDHPIFQNGRSQYCLVGNNQAAVDAATNMSRELGYHPIVFGTELQGETAQVAKDFMNIIELIVYDKKQPVVMDGIYSQQWYSLVHQIVHNTTKPIALIAGGETTVTLQSSSTTTTTTTTTQHNNNNNRNIGMGGRNQEFALVAGIRLDQLKREEKQKELEYNNNNNNNDEQQQHQSQPMRKPLHVVVASIGTDGTDGPTDAAGAMIDSGTISRIDATTMVVDTDVHNNTTTTNNNLLDKKKRTAMESLQAHDSYTYFNTMDPSELGGTGVSPLDKRGPTGTNVADIMIVLIHPGESHKES